jgi:hypothetical protein
MATASTLGTQAALESTMSAGAAAEFTLGVLLAGNLLEKMRSNSRGAGAEQAHIETEIARGIHA